MALFRDESGERTEMPTALRLDEARQRGRVARSGDLVSAAVLAGALVAMAVCGPALLEALRNMMAMLLSSPGAGSFADAAGPVFRTAAAMVAIPAVAAILANLLQVGLLATGESIHPDLGRIAPSAGLKRVFSRRSLFRAFMSIGKLAAITAVSTVTIVAELPAIVSLAAGQGELGGFVAALATRLAVRILLVLFALALIDWLYQRWQHRQDLKITRRELLDDLRRMEGDPQTAGRRREIARQLASQRLGVEMPRASVVLDSARGPVVALKYDETMAAPRVVGRGRDFLAVRIRLLAKTHGVAIVEDDHLARAIYRNCRVGDWVPEKLYEQAAEALACAQRPEKPHTRDKDR